MTSASGAWRKFWSALRSMTGDDAYERYLEHVHQRHPGTMPLDRMEFHRTELDRRWKEVNRCC